MPGARLEVVDAVDGAKVYGIDGEAIEGVRGQRNDITAVKALHDAIDVCGFRFVRMDAEKFSRHDGSLVFRGERLCPVFAYSTTAREDEPRIHLESR